MSIEFVGGTAGDGVADVWSVDTDGDGNEVGDLIAVDFDDNGVPETFGSDANEDGAPEAMWVDLNGDGLPESQTGLGLTIASPPAGLPAPGTLGTEQAFANLTPAQQAALFETWGALNGQGIGTWIWAV
jgi:hypothetical protein